MATTAETLVMENVIHQQHLSLSQLDHNSWLSLTMLITCVIQTVFFFISFILQTDKLADVVSAINFITIALLVFIGNYSGHERGVPLLRSILITICTCIWAVRLGVFLLARILRRGSDERFDEIRASWWKSAIFWIGQGAWVWTVSLPVLLSNQSTWQRTDITSTDKFGLILWVLGFIWESVADWQKSRFQRKHKERKDLPFISTGLWRYCRHPNYFGEMLLWKGMWFLSISATRPYHIIGLLSPLFTFILIVFISGVPMAEKLDDKRWRRLVAYNQYKLITSPLIPLPSRVYATLPLSIKHWCFYERHLPIIHKPVKRRKVKTDGGISNPSSPLI